MTAVQKPWYKQFWPWFLIAIPLSSVIMGIVMITLAVSQKDSLVNEDWYKDGLAINQQLDKVRAAQGYGYEFFLSVDPAGTGLTIATKNLDLSQVRELAIEFSHPTLKQRDFTLNLHPAPNQQFFAPLPTGLAGLYYLNLTAPAADDWEVITSINFSNRLDRVPLHQTP